MNKYLIVRTSFNKVQNARNLAKNLIEQKLCACAQISEIESLYFWEGKTQNDDEFLLEIKTTSDNFEKVKALIISNHDYQIPEIISFEFDAHDRYKIWLDRTIG